MVTIGDSITAGLYAQTDLGENAPSPAWLAYLSAVAAAAGETFEEKAAAVHNEFKRFDLSWASGDQPNDVVYSHFERLLQLFPDLEKVDFAHAGDKSRHLFPQTTKLIEEMWDRGYEPVYITFFMGGNDLCAPTVEEVTSLEEYRNNVRQSLSLIMNSTFETKVLVSSIPNVHGLLEHSDVQINGFPGNPDAATTCEDMWNDLVPVCLTGTGHQPREVEEAMREQLRQYNVILEEVVDDLSVYNLGRIKFSPVSYKSDILREDLAFDCFHLSEFGHARFSEATWEEGFWPDL